MLRDGTFYEPSRQPQSPDRRLSEEHDSIGLDIEAKHRMHAVAREAGHAGRSAVPAREASPLRGSTADCLFRRGIRGEELRGDQRVGG
jgi:hypothetical protein